MITNYIFQDILAFQNSTIYIHGSRDIWTTLSNDLYLIRRILTTKDILNSYLYEICKNGENIKLIKKIIELGADDFNMGLGGACYGSHKIIVKFMIECGAYDFNMGLSGACQGGNKDLVEFMIECGANYWNSGLFGACIGGHKDLINFMIECGADDWNNGLNCVCQG